MNARRVTYLDSSAIVKLVVEEPESTALRKYLRRRQPWVASALARTEVARALLPLGSPARRRLSEVLSRLELIRVSDRVLVAAGTMLPPETRSLDAIHVATALLLGPELGRLVTYDIRMAEAARANGCAVTAPG
jgi:predicted nucleic acid-binding protein